MKPGLTCKVFYDLLQKHLIFSIHLWVHTYLRRSYWDQKRCPQTKYEGSQEFEIFGSKQLLQNARIKNCETHFDAISLIWLHQFGQSLLFYIFSEIFDFFPLTLIRAGDWPPFLARATYRTTRQKVANFNLSYHGLKCMQLSWEKKTPAQLHTF